MIGGADPGHFVDVQTEVVSNSGPPYRAAPGDEVSETRIAKGTLAGLVNLGSRNAGSDRRDGGFVRLARNSVIPCLFGRGVADADHALEIGEVAIVDAAAVELHKRAAGKVDVAARLGIGPHSAIGSCVKRQELDVAGAARVHLRSHDRGNFMLGGSLADGFETRADAVHRNLGGGPQPADLLGAFDGPDGPDYAAGIRPPDLRKRALQL